MATGSQSDNTNKRPRQQSGIGGEAAREIVINELLCYTQKKHKQLPEKTLKQILFDFYSTDLVVEAKDLLADNLASMNLPNWSRPRRRNNSKEHPNAKKCEDIDDVVYMYNFVDENHLAARLPIYVAANPDLIPSAKLTEGDLQCLLLKLNTLTDKVDALGDSVFTSDKSHLGTCGCH